MLLQHRLAFESPFLNFELFTRGASYFRWHFRNGDSRSEIAYFARRHFRNGDSRSEIVYFSAEL
jgi:hypothetical protein